MELFLDINNAMLDKLSARHLAKNCTAEWKYLWRISHHVTCYLCLLSVLGPPSLQKSTLLQASLLGIP